mgnify:CR=1 FL=1
MEIKKSLKVFVLCMGVLFGSLLHHTNSFAKSSDTYSLQMVSNATYTVSLNISGNGTASVYGKVTGKAGVTSTYAKATLQRYESGSWIDVEEWENSNNGRIAIISETYQVSHGTYRVVLNCRANAESKSVISATKSY